MKAKLLKIIRSNYPIAYCIEKKWVGISIPKPYYKTIVDDTSFGLIVKMLEQIYPQGKHYKIMRNSRRYKQARNEKAVRFFEVASICVVSAIFITILILNTCCGSGKQY